MCSFFGGRGGGGVASLSGFCELHLCVSHAVSLSPPFSWLLQWHLPDCIELCSQHSDALQSAQ